MTIDHAAWIVLGVLGLACACCLVAAFIHGGRA